MEKEIDILVPFQRHYLLYAGVAKLVDAGDSKSPGGNIMPVRVRPPVPYIETR